MADLKCTVETCTYNKECLCSKGDIMVGGKEACCTDNTCCESFALRREEHDAYTSALCHPTRTISIDCEATKCVYNKNYKCSADHVDIRGGDANEYEETACATFKEK